jgi:hypothetical protein
LRQQQIAHHKPPFQAFFSFNQSGVLFQNGRRDCFSQTLSKYKPVRRRPLAVIRKTVTETEANLFTNKLRTALTNTAKNVSSLVSGRPPKTATASANTWSLEGLSEREAGVREQLRSEVRVGGILSANDSLQMVKAEQLRFWRVEHTRF